MVGAVVTCLNVACREFSPTGDLLDPTAKSLAGKRVDSDRHFLPELHISLFRFRHVDSDPKTVYLHKRRNRRIWINELPRSYLKDFDECIRRRFDFQFAKLHFDLLQRGASAFQLSPGSVNV